MTLEYLSMPSLIEWRGEGDQGEIRQEFECDMYPQGILII